MEHNDTAADRNHQTHNMKMRKNTLFFVKKIRFLFIYLQTKDIEIVRTQKSSFSILHVYTKLIIKSHRSVLHLYRGKVQFIFSKTCPCTTFPWKLPSPSLFYLNFHCRYESESLSRRRHNTTAALTTPSYPQNIQLTLLKFYSWWLKSLISKPTGEVLTDKNIS